MNLRLPIVISLLSVTIFLMGCIDMELFSPVLPLERSSETGLAITEKKRISYHFNTSFPGTPSQLRKEFLNREFRIYEETEWMKMEVWIDLDKGPLIQELIEALGINKSITRHVNVTLKDPGGRIVYQREFYESQTPDPEAFHRPRPGIWALDISAKGVGGELEGFQLYDGFTVAVFAREPKRG